ncbi:AMP-binding protein [Polymorphum gilvum]|uniref:O-succinylbenzoic acid-CoA ligase, putative n=1 Tax=Polymorphum gilvum (strain LMG 25793 / CGMCC 1.9160 / SL003B-26A1) TaxID=991905 RepID=F2J126_POLGS|nr:AMP-binding protein [Polymorphum gilvum]ADZ71972.1 O-succinylbenzoic acid-CoA ligase, putative [Polymorphum gilvum SL003B-26A1]
MDYVTDMAARRAELTPGATAFVDRESGLTLTFEDVERRARRLANALTELGLSAGDRLAVLCLNRPDFFVVLFAAQKARLILVPLNWRQPVAELSPLIPACGAKILIHDKAFEAEARHLSATHRLRRIAMGPGQDADFSLDELIAAAAESRASVRVSASDPWYLLFTSGTTGLPKAVIQTAGMAWANAINYAQATDLTSADTSLNFLPLFHTAGINLMTLPLFLLGGASTVLRKFDADAVVDLLGAGACTAFFGVPAIYQALSLHPRFSELDLAAVRSYACGGAPIPEHLLRLYASRGATICNGMGMTETGPTVFIMDRAGAARKIGSVGKAQILAEVRLEAPDGSLVEGPGEGELQIRGPGVTPGYMDNPAATAAAFTADGWLKSGDVARRDADGYYYIVDRIKDMYISGGENVYPAEVERVLVDHPDILEAVVVGIPDERWGEVGAAYLIARPGHTVDPAGLPAWCRERLAGYKVPRRFAVVADLPRTAAGKVRKNLLKDQPAAPAKPGTSDA